MKNVNKRFFSYKKIFKNKTRNLSYKHKKRSQKKFNTRTNNIRKLIFIIFMLVIILFYRNFIPKKILNVLTYSLKYVEYNEKIAEKYSYLQNHFCENQNETFYQEYENKTRIAKVDFHEKKFEMFVYKSGDIVSNVIISSHRWERGLTDSILNALEFYSQKKKLENKDIYFIDVGANVGWYSFFIGKYGYKILSFEASKINNYILYKNYCLNKDVSLSIINKGLDEEDKTCKLITCKKNIGDGAIFCENREKSHVDFLGDVYNNIELTKLSRYMKFLSEKNVALMKIDVEGYEPKVIKGGEEIITKYHIPFIAMEFSINFIQLHQINALEFLKIFENNGYKFSMVDFLSKKYISSEELIKRKDNINIFAIYEKFLE